MNLICCWPKKKSRHLLHGGVDAAHQGQAMDCPSKRPQKKLPIPAAMNLPSKYREEDEDDQEKRDGIVGTQVGQLDVAAVDVLAGLGELFALGVLHHPVVHLLGYEAVVAELVIGAAIDDDGWPLGRPGQVLADVGRQPDQRLAGAVGSPAPTRTAESCRPPRGGSPPSAGAETAPPTPEPPRRGSAAPAVGPSVSYWAGMASWGNG